MKILLVSTFYYPIIKGGAEISTQIMAEGLAEKGHEVTVLTLGPEEYTEFINGVRIVRISTKDSKTLFSNEKISPIKRKILTGTETFREFFYSGYYCDLYNEFLEDNNFDIVHASGNLFCMGRVNLWNVCHRKRITVSQALRDPKLCHLDFLGGKLDYFLSKVTKKNLFKLYGVVAPSNYMIDFYRMHNITHSNCEVIYNAVDIPIKEPNYKAKDNVILYVGRITREKGILTLIDAVRKIEDIKLLIIGEGNILDNVILPNNVKTLGYMERFEVYNLMSKSKAVILPSEWPEAFGRTIIESIANGTIAIGSDSGALPEILDNKYIFKTGDSNDLRGKIYEVLRMDEDLYNEDVLRQQKRCERFSKRSYVENWEMYFTKQLS